MEEKQEKELMIRVSDVSMRFKMEEDRSASLKETVTKLLSKKLKFKEFYALKDVSFDIYKGDVSASSAETEPESRRFLRSSPAL